MANIKNHLNNIKNALFGQEVRGSIHDGIDAINKEVESTTGRQVDLEKTFDQLVINAGNSNAEIVDARVKSDGTSYSKLGDRLDSVDSQLEHNTHYINSLLINSNCADLRLDKDLKQNEDITSKLQNLLSNPSIDKVILPKGYYTITDTIIIPNGKELVLQGTDIDKNIYSTIPNKERDNFTIIKANISDKALFDVRKFAKVSGGYIDFVNCENSTCFLIDLGNYECHQACLGNSIIMSTRGKGNIGVKFNLDNTTNSVAHSSMENTINLIVLNFDTAYLFYRKIIGNKESMPVLTDLIINGYISGCVRSFYWDCVDGYNGDGSIINARIQAVELTEEQRTSPNIEMKYIHFVEFNAPIWDLERDNTNKTGIKFVNASNNIFRFFYKSDSVLIEGDHYSNMFLTDGKKTAIIPRNQYDGGGIQTDLNNILRGNRGLYNVKCSYSYNDVSIIERNLNNFDWSNTDGYCLRDKTSYDFDIKSINYLFDNRELLSPTLEKECIVRANSDSQFCCFIEFSSPLRIDEIGISLNNTYLPKNLRVLTWDIKGNYTGVLDRYFSVLGNQTEKISIVRGSDISGLVKKIKIEFTGVVGTRDQIRIRNIWVTSGGIKSNQLIDNYFYDRNKMQVYTPNGSEVFGELVKEYDFENAGTVPEGVSVSSGYSLSIDKGLRITNNTASNMATLTLNTSLSSSKEYLILTRMEHYHEAISCYYDIGGKLFNLTNLGSAFNKSLYAIKVKGSTPQILLKSDFGWMGAKLGLQYNLKKVMIYDVTGKTIDMNRLCNGFRNSVPLL